jgi:hypothetical protein
MSRFDPTARFLGEQYGWESDDETLTLPWESDDEAVLESDDESDDENVNRLLRSVSQRSQQIRSRGILRGGPARFRPTTGASSAVVSTPSGTAPVRFAKPLATVEALERLKADTTKAIADARKEAQANFQRLDQRMKTSASAIDDLGKGIKATTKKVEGLESRSQISALLPFIQGAPQVETITFAGEPKNGATVPATVKYRSDNNAILPLVMLGGLGGSGSTGSNDMLLLAVALMSRR